MRTINIDVTDADIAQGTRNNCVNCPIARAAKRALPDVEGVYVYPGSMMVAVQTPNRYSSYSVVLPDEAYVFIDCFDSLKEVKPFSFSLDLDFL